jgi:long-chain acyl-CoA synthetase
MIPARESVRAAVRRHAALRGDAPALAGSDTSLSYARLDAEVDRTAEALAASGCRVLGLSLDNGAAWAVADLAAHQAGVAVVPLPPFFSCEQCLHAVKDAGVDAVLGRLPKGIAAGRIETLPVTGGPYPLSRLAEPAAPETIGDKVTYTSGTTGSPKGVRLNQTVLETVADTLRAASGAGPDDRHLCANPLAVLLENVAGIYTPLLAGASVVLPSLGALGLGAPPDMAARALATALERHAATTVILMPATLKALVAHLEAGGTKPPALRFAAVGGAPVSTSLLERAEAVGLPVFQGYGLSECASVVCLNTSGNNRTGSVGRPLPHVRVEVADDGEVRVAGPGFSGYLGDPERPDAGWWATGDLGHLDEDGYLFVTGRKRNAFSTATGRNVAPEWVEGELTGEAAVAQAVVFGNGRPWPAAVIVPAFGADPDGVAAAVAAANARLPTYARVGGWEMAEEPFSPANELATATGRPRREAVWAAYGPHLERLYGKAPA